MQTLQVYHGTNKDFNKFLLGKEIVNPTYGKIIDNGLGIFFTDNKTMALWFAGLVSYNGDTDRY